MSDGERTVGAGRGSRLGAVFPPTRPVEELLPFARRVEELGYDDLWVVEDCFLHGGLTAAAAALAATERLRVGVGLLPVSARNPAIAAMELATVASLFPGRVTAAFGHGVEAWMRQIGARPPDRLVALRETVGSVRALMRGDEVALDGRAVRLDGVRLERPPATAPKILVGTTGPRTISVAAEVAEGVLLPEGSSADAVGWVRGLLGPDATIVAYSWLALDDDGERARSRLVPAVRAWRDQGLYPNLVSRSAVPTDGDIGTADLHDVAVAGSPDDCASAVRRLAAAGAGTVVLAPVGGEALGQLELFARTVQPKLDAPDADGTRS